MKIRLIDGQPFVNAMLAYRGQRLDLEHALLDTGSAGTLFSVSKLLEIGMAVEPEDSVHQIRGVGGVEYVFLKRIDELAIDHLIVHNFDVEVGMMDYGFDIDAIIGLDFLVQVGAVIDLKQLEII